MMRFIPIAGFLLLVALLAVLLVLRPEAPTATAQVQALPALSLTVMDSGRAWEQSGVRGQVTVLNFFASWCAPCQAEMPELKALKQQFPNLHVIGVVWNDEPKTLMPWLKKHGNPFETLLLDNKGAATIALGIKGIPETLVVDGEGNIRYRLSGPLTQPVRTQVLVPLIEVLGSENSHVTERFRAQ